MFKSIMERSGEAEVFFRTIATSIEPIKKKLKKAIKKKSKSDIACQKNEKKIYLLRERLNNCGINIGDIVLIHSSFDGIRSLGLTPEEVIDLLLDIFQNNTIVFATYPIEPLRKKEVYKYDPKKTLCWTGILPNIFLKREGVLRSAFPYNSLAAKGQYAEAITENNLVTDIPHGENSAWDYCRLNHAKILFLGTTSKEANTMAIHMVPDVMGDKWPIENWYEQRRYVIINGGEKIEKTIRVQNGFWYQYVNEYKTDKLLKDNKLLFDMRFEDIPLELVPDCYEMMKFLIYRSENGNIMYSIPQKYYGFMSTMKEK